MSDSGSTNWRKEFRLLRLLAGPLVVNNLAIAGMQFADTVMAGWMGASSLAAVAVGGSVWFLGFSLVLGVMMAISPIVARHFGAGNFGMIGRYTRQGVYLAVLFGVAIFLFGQLGAGSLLAAVGVDAGFRDLTTQYVGAITWGAPGIFVFLAFRFTTEGAGFTKPIMYTSLFTLVCNVFLNYVLAFGKLGFPAFGAVGLGYASAITMWLVMFLLAAMMIISRDYRPFNIFERVAPVRLPVLREILALGVPIAITITAEAGLFSATSIMMGTRGAEITAAHQIAINFASTMFMIPLALSAATTVRVGQLLGSERGTHARLSGIVGICMCAAFMTCSALFMLAFRDLVVGMYTSDVAVRGIAIGLLLMAAIFQVADGIQIGAAGALRGYKDTRMPMVINVFAFWALAFPLAYLAAITYKAPPNFIWAGFVVGLTVAGDTADVALYAIVKAHLTLTEVRAITGEVLVLFR